MHTETFDALARLLTYPRPDFLETLDAAIAADGVVRASRPPLVHDEPRREAGETPAPHRDDVPFPGPVETTLIRFREAVEGMALHELEEAFTTTFDLDPVAALEVGWHLFGDTYERGRFLVEMRQRLHRLGMGESGELPDHLATVLRVLPRLDRADAEALARGAVMPALQKMLEPLRSRESIFLPLLQAVDALLAEVGTGFAGLEVGTGCAGPFPATHDEKRTAAGGPYAAPKPATASHDIDPEVTA